MKKEESTMIAGRSEIAPVFGVTAIVPDGVSGRETR